MCTILHKGQDTTVVIIGTTMQVTYHAVDITVIQNKSKFKFKFLQGQVLIDHISSRLFHWGS